MKKGLFEIATVYRLYKQPVASESAFRKIGEHYA
jgi:hypothetical protein